MNSYFDTKFNKVLHVIYPGEYHVSTGPEYISTVLGTCISVVLYDARLKLGGMNHFMFAQEASNNISQSDPTAGRFAQYAMELLINEMLKKGAVKQRLEAKVFGGGHVLNIDSNVGDNNIKFAFDYLASEGIPVIASNVGDIYARKIVFDPSSFKVWMKRMNKNNRESLELEQQEKTYITTVKQEEKKSGDIIWF